MLPSGDVACDDFLHSQLWSLALVPHSGLLMIVVCDVNDHIIVQSELVFTAYEVIYILVDSRLVIIVCDHCFWCQIMDCWFWAHALFPKITLSNTFLSAATFGSPFSLTLEYNYVHCCSWNSGGIHARLNERYNKGHCFLALEIHLILGLFLMWSDNECTGMA
jgi:hypothetical protein